MRGDNRGRPYGVDTEKTPPAPHPTDPMGNTLDTTVTTTAGLRERWPAVQAHLTGTVPGQLKTPAFRDWYEREAAPSTCRAVEAALQTAPTGSPAPERRRDLDAAVNATVAGMLRVAPPAGTPPAAVRDDRLLLNSLCSRARRIGDVLATGN